MRTIKELLILLREEMVKQFHPISDGCICYVLANMRGNNMISPEEYKETENYLEMQRPNDRHAFWWPYGELEPRLEFLDKLIKEIDED